MSTYLVVFVISDFEFRTARPAQRQLDSLHGGSTAIRVWSQKDLINQTQYALEVTSPMLEFLESYFQVPFPIPKVDLLPVPDFSYGAMENWGLITFRENSLLIDPETATHDDTTRVEYFIAHELAHQWFGNLVTMKWWNDLWLNEGFATYIERLVLDTLSPKYQYGIQHGLAFLGALATDAMESSHPISAEVDDPNQIRELFDDISYDKGCAVIRMMNHFLGETTFRLGLTNYLGQLAFKNADQDDLWRFMTQQARIDGVLPSDVDIKSIMDTWTLQKGFPLITITRNYQNGSIRLEQQRFLRSNGQRSTNSTASDGTMSSYKWWVPISLTDAVEKNFHTNNTLPRLWLSPDKMEDSLDTEVKPESWILANIQGGGFYRVNYDECNWQLLSQQLRANHEAIHVLNRAHLISDVFALAEVNILPYTVALDVVQYVRLEEHNVPWETARDALGFLKSMLSSTQHQRSFEAFMLSLTRPVIRRLGIHFKPDEDPLSTKIRMMMMKEACDTDYRQCNELSLTKFEAWMASGDVDNFNGIDTNARQYIYCTAMRRGGEREWDFAWQMALNSTSSQHRAILLSALACSKEPSLLRRYLGFTLDPASGIRQQDGKDVIEFVTHTSIGRFIAYDFIQANFDALVDRYTLYKIMQAFASATITFNTREHLEMVEKFMNDKSVVISALPTTSRKILDTILANVEWMDRNGASIADWLRRKGF